MGLKCVRAVFLLLLAGTVSAHAIPGDVNEDGSITVEDAAIASRIASHLDTQTNVSLQTAFANADVAGPAGNYRDNRVDWRDVARIIRVAAGLEEMPNAPVPSLRPIIQILNVKTNTTRDFALQAVTSENSGYTVKGHISGIPESATGASLGFYQIFEHGGASGFGAPADADGNYTATLAPADYQLYYGATTEESTAAGILSWYSQTSLNRSITVNGPMTVDVTAAPLPEPGELTGAIETANLRPTLITASPSLSQEILKDPAKSSVRATGTAGADGYRIKSAPMTYQLNLDSVYQQNPDIRFSWSATNPVTITHGPTSGPDITLPEVLPVSIRFLPPSGAVVGRVTLSKFGVNGGTLTTNGQVPDGTNLWSTAFVPGDARLTTELILDDTETLRRSVRRDAAVTIPDDGGTVDHALPDFPAMVTFSGRVTLPDGSAAPGQKMTLTQMPGLGGPAPYAMTVELTTDNDGRFSVDVIPDQYRVQVPSPPF